MTTNPYPLTRLIDEVASAFWRYAAFNLAYYQPPSVSSLTITFTPNPSTGGHMPGTFTGNVAFTPDAPVSPITSQTVVGNVDGVDQPSIDVPVGTTTVVLGTSFLPGQMVGYSVTVANAIGSGLPTVFAPIVVPPSGTSGVPGPSTGLGLTFTENA